MSVLHEIAEGGYAEIADPLKPDLLWRIRRARGTDLKDLDALRATLLRPQIEMVLGTADQQILDLPQEQQEAALQAVARRRTLEAALQDPEALERHGQRLRVITCASVVGARKADAAEWTPVKVVLAPEEEDLEEGVICLDSLAVETYNALSGAVWAFSLGGRDLLRQIDSFRDGPRDGGADRRRLQEV